MERKIGDQVTVTVTGLGLVGRDTTYVKFFSQSVNGILGKPEDVIMLNTLYGGKLIGVSMVFEYQGEREINGVVYPMWNRVG